MGYTTKRGSTTSISSGGQYDAASTSSQNNPDAAAEYAAAAAKSADAAAASAALNTPSNAIPIMDGVGASGVSTSFSRSDHIHPSDSSKVNTTDIIAVAKGGTGSTTGPAALVALTERTGATGTLSVPAGTTAQRSTLFGVGIRYSTTLQSFEGYNGSAWTSVGGGATGAAGNSVFYENDQTVTGDYTLTANKNAGTFGPVTINTGVTVTVPTGAVWSIV